jgi:hypothetical protein
MSRVDPFVEHPVCSYKRSAIAFARKFYWTASAPSSNIEVMQSTIAAVDHFQQTLTDIGADDRYRMRRAMNKGSLIAVRALADIAMSVMLGLTLVALVSLADALHLLPTKGAALREVLRWANQYTDLPQWWWLGLYALLAAASVLFARVCPRTDGLPVEVTFSLLSPRRHPHTAGRPGHGQPAPLTNNITGRSQRELRLVGVGVADVLG